jgi:hypothetical protein
MKKRKFKHGIIKHPHEWTRLDLSITFYMDFQFFESLYREMVQKRISSRELCNTMMTTLRKGERE